MLQQNLAESGRHLLRKLLSKLFKSFKLCVNLGMKPDQTDKPPKLVFDHNTMPTLYKGNMFLRVSDCTVRIKVYHKKRPGILLLLDSGNRCITISMLTLSSDPPVSRTKQHYLVYKLLETQGFHLLQRLLPLK